MVRLKQTGNALTGDYSSPLLGDHKVEGRITRETIEISFTFARIRGGPENTAVLLSGTIAGTNVFAGDIKLTPGNAGTFAAPSVQLSVIRTMVLASGRTLTA